MRQRLSLSGELPTVSILGMFEGIGLIRSEYPLRAHGEFITRPEAQVRLGEYVDALARACPSQQVWYRTTEFTSPEANTLAGVDRIFHEADYMKGRRGIRRALELPKALETELRVVADVARDRRNVHVLFPFVRDAADFSFAVKTLERIGWPNQFGSMIEIPSALLDAAELIAMGASNLLLGLNDLSALLTGTSRQDQDMKLHPSVWWAIGQFRAKINGDTDWGVAGNLSMAVLERATEADVPYASIHYSELPLLRGVAVEELPDIAFVERTKAFTRSQIAIAEERDMAARGDSRHTPGILAPTSLDARPHA